MGQATDKKLRIFRISSKYANTKVAYVGANLVPTAVPLTWLNITSLKKKLLFSSIVVFIDSRINSFENRLCIKLGYFCQPIIY